MEPSVIIDILKSLPVPIVVTLVLLAIAEVLRRGEQGRGKHRWIPAVAVGSALLAGLWFSKVGGWLLPPSQSTDWFAIAIYFGVVAAIVQGFVRSPRTVLATRVGASVLIAGGISWKLARTAWPLTESICWIGGLTLCIVLAWSALDRLCAQRGPADPSLPHDDHARSIPSWSSPALLVAWTCLSSQALAATDSILLGKVAAMLCAAAGAAMVVAFVRPRSDIISGLPAVTALLMGVLIFCGVQYSGMEHQLWMAVLLIVAPLFAAIVDILLLRRLGGFKRALARIAFISLLPAIVLAVAIPAAIKAAESSGYE